MKVSEVEIGAEVRRTNFGHGKLEVGETSIITKKSLNIAKDELGVYLAIDEDEGFEHSIENLELVVPKVEPKKPSLMRKKISHLPYNMFMSLFLFMFVFIILNNHFRLSAIMSLIVSFAIYAMDVFHSAKNDYFEDCIEELKEEIKQIKNK